MSNCKDELINTVLYSMINKLDREQLDQLKKCLQISFYDYNIEKIETTELSCGSENTTRELVEYFSICKLSSGRSQNTVRQYVRVVYQLCNTVHKELNAITSEDVIYFLAKYPRTKVPNVSGCTMDTKRRYLSSVFSLLKKHKKIAENPMDMVEGLKYKYKVKTPLSAEEVRSVKEAVSSRNNNVLRSRNTMIINLLLDTGCRVSELVNINIGDFDFSKNEVKILGKGNKERIVLFSSNTKEDIMKYLEMRDYCKSDPLLMDLSGTNRLKASGVQSMLKNLRKKCGVDRLHAHLFRATMASDLVQKYRVSIDVAATYLGHSGLGTIQKYVINSQEHIKNELQKVGLGCA